MARCADRQISARTPGVGGDSGAVAGAEAARLLAAAEGDREGRRPPGHALYPRAGNRDLLHDVQSGAGREIFHPALRHHALHAARLRRPHPHLRGAHRRAAPCHRRRPVLLAGSGMPRRLLQRPDGADQRRLLRRSRRRELHQAARRSRRRPSGPDRPAERRPPALGAARRPDGADRILRRRRQERSA